MSLIYTAFLLIVLFDRVSADIILDCKCSPQDSCWPSSSDFDNLNKTVSGQLIHGVPPASVCYPKEGNYDEASCRNVMASWYDSSYHASDPISIGWPWWVNNTCPPIHLNGTSLNGDPDAGKKGCNIGGYPAYALNATDVSHIQAVVRFANEKRLRLNIKSTGHSFQGRSAAFGSLSIWTHNLRGAQWHDSFQPDNCHAGSGIRTAATFAAGERVKDAYEFSALHGSVVVAGATGDVGIVGWFTGGGHGGLSSSYGMGADNVLQVKMVSPTGDYITANACQNSDLLWAVRGGGGGTFGVVTEVTMRAYPSPQTTRHNLVVTALQGVNSSAYFNIVARLFSDLQRLKQGGMQGYIYLLSPGYPDIDEWTLTWGLNLYDKPNGTAEYLFAPLKEWLDPFNGTVIFYTSNFEHTSDYLSMWNAHVSYEPVATSGGAIGSRLLPASALADPERLSIALQEFATPAAGGGPIMVQGLFTANSDYVGNDVAMNPAWRNAVLHLLVAEIFPDWLDYEAAKVTLDRVTYKRVEQLRLLAPNSGAYFNEADPYDPNWQYEFFGENYARLREVKEKYDPESVLWCRACVGSEQWAEIDQQSGRLCLTRVGGARTVTFTEELPIRQYDLRKEFI